MVATTEEAIQIVKKQFGEDVVITGANALKPIHGVACFAVHGAPGTPGWIVYGETIWKPHLYWNMVRNPRRLSFD